MHANFYFAFVIIAPDGVPNIFTPTHGPRGPIRPPGTQLPPPLGTPPQMISSHPSGGQMPTPQMVQGNQMAPGTPQMGPGTPLGSNTPGLGPGTPQMGTNVPQMASPRMASAPTQMSPGTPQMPSISQGMSIPSPQQMAMAQHRAIAPKIEPPDTMDARAMWLPKRMNHCKLCCFILHCLFFLHYFS